MAMKVNEVITYGECSITVIIDDVIENEIESHKTAESSHEATVQMEGELLNGNKGAKEW